MSTAILIAAPGIAAATRVSDQLPNATACHESSLVYGPIPLSVNINGKLVPEYRWQDSALPARAVVVALHGVTLYGGTYDRVARELARHRIVTIAPEMRGFGRCRLDRENEYLRAVNYRASKRDILAMLRQTRASYPGVAIYCMGESLGANLAIWLAGKHPELVDGIILSSPCVKRYWHLSPQMVLDICKGTLFPTCQIPMHRYVESILSEDPEVVRAYANDPIIRKTLSLAELVESLLTNRTAISWARKIPPTMPVLTVEGTNDAIYHSETVPALMAKMPSTDKHIYWAKDRGHLLLETTRVKPDILNTITNWITEHSASKNNIARSLLHQSVD